MTLLTEWPTLDDDCVDEIETWIAKALNPRMVVIDVFARVKGDRTGKETDYEFDYRRAAMLQSIATRHKLAVVVVHHTRKAGADDPFDEVSGTRGLCQWAPKFPQMWALKIPYVGVWHSVISRARDHSFLSSAAGRGALAVAD